MSEVSGFLSFGIIVDFSIFSSKPGPKKSEMPSQIFHKISKRLFMDFSSKLKWETLPKLDQVCSQDGPHKENGTHGMPRKENHKKMPQKSMLNMSRLLSEKHE